MFRNLLAILLACLMLLPCGVAIAEEAETLTNGDYEYTLNDDGSASIKKYTGFAEDLTVPTELDGHTVTSIGGAAFFCCISLTSITIPNNVTSVDANAFAHCDQLTQITVSPDHPTLATIDGVLFEKTTRTLICYPCAFTAKSYAVPQGIQAIGEDAFSGCTSLTSIALPDGLTSIGDRAFSGCASLTSVALPDGLSSIGVGAFFGCFSLTSIALPDGLTSIGDYAFYSCASLTSITLPDSVTTIGRDAFEECPKLTLTVSRDSYALAYAKENGIRYDYTDSQDWLNG